MNVLLLGVPHSKFPSHLGDYIDGSIDLNRELVPSPMCTEQLVVVGDAMRGVGLFHGDLVLFDRAARDRVQRIQPAFGAPAMESGLITHQLS